MTLSNIEVNGNQKQGLEDFQVFMQLKSTISINHLATSHQEAEEWVNINLDPVAIQQAFLSFLRTNGTVITPEVYDVELKVTAVYGEDEA